MFTNSLIYLEQITLLHSFLPSQQNKKACKYRVEASTVLSRPSQPRGSPAHLDSANLLPPGDAGARGCRFEGLVSILTTLHSTNKKAMKTHFDPKNSFL